MYLSKEVTYKDQSLKMQMILSLDKDDTSNSEKIWKKNGFFGDQKGDFTITVFILERCTGHQTYICIPIQIIIIIIIIIITKTTTTTIIIKANFPENTLVCYNQGTISALKVGDYAIYLDHVILGQLILANNCPDLNSYVPKEN